MEKNTTTNISFAETMKNTYQSQDNNSRKTYITDYYITQQKLTCICTNAQETITETVITVDSWKTTYTYLYTAQE